jgi:hypothetical protein
MNKKEDRESYIKNKKEKASIYLKNKKGQFYIIAAIIIVLVLAGITSIKTYALVKPEPRAIKDLGSELQEETSQIVDYGVYNSATVDAKDIMDNFTRKEFAPYFLKKTIDTGVVFIYGNKTNLTAVQYEEQYTGTISATIGTGSTSWSPIETYANYTDITPIGNNVSVNLLGKTFEFDLKDNEMFYFVIVQEKEGETYIERN